VRAQASRKAVLGIVAGIGIVLVSQGVLAPLAGLVEADDPVTLRIGMLQGVATLNPFMAYEDSEYVVFNLIYDRLTTYDEDLNPAPCIAASWEVGTWEEADDPGTPAVNEGENRLWTYHIIENAKWHDNEKLTAEDVAYTINLNLDPAMWAFTPILNNKMVDHAVAVDEYTVEVYLKIPNVHADAVSIPIVPEHIWSELTAGEIQNTWPNPEPMGSGMLKFVEFEEDQYVILERNDDYHAGAVSFDQLIIKFYGSDQVMAEDLRKGNLDVARFPPLTYDSLKGEPNVETAEVERNFQSTLGFNCFTEPESQGNRLLLDDNLRRGLHLAIDKQYLIDTVYRGYGEVGYALPTPIVPEWYWEPETEEESLNYDLERANALLNASGYDNWNNDGVRLYNRSDNPLVPINTPVSFSLMVRNDAPEDLTTGPFIKEMWQEIGVDVTIEVMEESAMETAIYYTAAHDSYIWYWSGDFDPSYLLGVMTTDQIWGWNDPFWSNETYDQLYIEQFQVDGVEREEMVHEMERTWYWSSGMIVLCYPLALYAWSTLNFEGWGDPMAHQGRIMDFYWPPNPLFMDLEPTDGGGGGGGVSSTALMAIGIVAAVIVVLVVAMVLMKKRKGAAPGETPGKEERKRGLE